MTLKPIQVCLQSRHIEARGGLEKWARRIAKGFTKRGAHVHLLTSDERVKSLVHPLIHTHILSTSKILSHRKMKYFDHLCKKWQKTHSADIVFGIDRTSDQTHIRAGNGVHAAYLEQRQKHENYTPLKAAFNPLNKTILEIEKKAFENPQLKVLFTNSYMVKNEILKHYNVSPDIIEVIHNGLEWKGMEDDFNTWVEKKTMVAKHLGLNPSHFHFLFVGNGYERKGLTLLLKAMQLLTQNDVHLSVVGKDRNIESFIALAKDLGLSEKVSFFGASQNIRPFYQVADVLAIPSIYDPFANVTVEALGMGLFIVSSKNNGGYEILREENGCIIEDLKSLDAIHASLQTALMHSKTWVRSKTIRSGVKHLDLSNQLKSLIDISLERT